MVNAFLEGPDLLIVLGIVILLFGGAKLPQLARSLGEAKKELDKGMHSESETAAAPVVPKDSAA